MNCIFIFIILLLFNIQFIYCQNQCITYVDSNSDLVIGCGKNDTNPCKSIYESIQSCGNEYDEIIINIKPGFYNIDNQGTFGLVLNKSISILNYNLENDNDDSIIIIDLSNSSTPFININSTSIYDISNIEIIGITFQNGYQVIGSVILNQGSLINVNISNCIFNNNSGSFSLISNSFMQSNTINNTISIISSTFSNIINGGVLYNEMESTSILFDKCTFLNISNKNRYGGIVYSSAGYLTVTNSIISGTSSNSSFYLSNSIGYFENINFIISNDEIGFLINGLSTYKFFNCNFSDNSNTGIIYSNYSSNLIIESCNFKNNNNNNNNEPISTITSISTSLTILNSQFINNYSSKSGGAIYINGNKYNETIITNSNFINNTSPIGGGISIYNNTIKISNSQFSNNYSNESIGLSIYCFGESEIIISNSTFYIQNNNINNNNSLGFGCKDTTCNFENIDTNELYQCCSKTTSSSSSSYSSSSSSSSPKDNNNQDFDKTEKEILVFIIVAGSFTFFIILILIIKKIRKNKLEYKPIA